MANAANWETRPSPRAGASANGIKTGRGVAMVDYNGTHVAEVAEVEVNGTTGDVRVTRFWVAHDCGLIINPKAVQVPAAISNAIFDATGGSLADAAAPPAQRAGRVRCIRVAQRILTTWSRSDDLGVRAVDSALTRAWD